MMRKIFSLLWLAIGLNFASAQAIDPVGGGTSSLVPGTTPTGCTALTLFYADSSSKFACMAGTSWDNTNQALTIQGAVTATDIVNVKNAVGASLFRVHSLSGVFGNIFTTSSQFQLPTGGLVNFTDAVIGRSAAASLRLGYADAAAPVAQTLGVQSVVAGTANTAGVNWTLKGSTSTGSGVAGDINLQTGGTGAAATAQNTFVTALTIKGATQAVVAAKSVQTTCTTVTGLGAAGTAGRNWCVTDQLTACPALGGTFTGGGAVVCKAFDDGTNWTHQ